MYVRSCTQPETGGGPTQIATSCVVLSLPHTVATLVKVNRATLLSAVFGTLLALAGSNAPNGVRPGRKHPLDKALRSAPRAHGLDWKLLAVSCVGRLDCGACARPRL